MLDAAGVTLAAVPCFFNEVIGGVEVGRDVLCVHVSHRHLELLEALGHLQVFRVVVDADQPAHTHTSHLQLKPQMALGHGLTFRWLLDNVHCESRWQEISNNSREMLQHWLHDTHPEQVPLLQHHRTD